MSHILALFKNSLVLVIIFSNSLFLEAFDHLFPNTVFLYYLLDGLGFSLGSTELLKMQQKREVKLHFSTSLTKVLLYKSFLLIFVGVLYR